MSEHIRKEAVYRKLDELISEIQNDSFNLTREQQDALCVKLNEFKQRLNEEYERHQ